MSLDDGRDAERNPFWDPEDQNFYGIFSESLESYLPISRALSTLPIFPVFPISALRESLTCSILSRRYSSHKWPTLADLFNPDDVRLCGYLRIRAVFFRIDATTDLHAAAAAVHSAWLACNRRPVFLAVCSDFWRWLTFVRVADHPGYLKFCPYLVGREGMCHVSTWNTTSFGSFLLTDDAFDEGCGLSTTVTSHEGAFGRIPASYVIWSGFGRDVVTCVQALDCRLRSITFVRWPSWATQALEPLAAHLDSETYEVFESDAAKYRLYEDAITGALAVKKGAVVAVVGAGRGPLVECALRAGAERVYAVEKNPSAYEFLRQRQWSGSVAVVKGDMRTVALPEKIDILVSELLGGFGDNELSPECLAGCERLLAEGAVSIPTEYRSMITPICSEFWWSKLYRQLWLDSMSIGKTWRSYVLSTGPAECWAFSHPGENQLSRTVELQFDAKFPGMLHGFAGWFECVLFGDVRLSNRPWDRDRSSSWTQCLFPIQAPMMIKKGDVVKLVMQRMADEKGVWYQWYLVEPECTKIHNALGKSCKFGLTFD
jgi:protein arginine N-methyltransferase 5